MVELYKIHHFDRAAAFLEFLRPSNPVWGNPSLTPKSPFVFRGHWNSEWSLTPAAWRPDGEKRLAPIRDRIYEIVKDECSKFGEPDIDWNVQHIQEMIAIKTFHSVAEEQGLDIPSFPLGHTNSESWYWDRMWMTSDYLFDKLIADGLLQIMALAQHHGIPTRLLDWSRDPRIAAYFAADDVEGETGERTEHLAVWAVNTQIFNQAGINPLTVPRFRNAYLHAQEALFTYQRLGETVNWYGEHKTLPSLLDLKDKYLYDCDEPPFIQVRLPQSEADDLLALLYREHITKARLMPTFDSVAHTSKTLWRISPTDGRWFFRL